MFEEYNSLAVMESEISKDALLMILKEQSRTVSVFDLMQVTAEMMEDTKYVQESYRKEANGVYAKYFLGRLKEIIDNQTIYNETFDKDEFIETIALLKSYNIEERKSTKTKFPLIYTIVSLYTTYILEEPIHPVGTPFPGSLKVEEKDGVYYCPVKDANLESPNAVCGFCIAEQLEF